MLESYNGGKTTFSNPQEELEYLRAQIAKKEAELKQFEGRHSSEDTVKSIVEEYRSIPAEQVLSESFLTPYEEIKQYGLSIESDEHDDKMILFIKHLEEKGVRNTINLVESMETPHVEDDFYRLLVQYLKAGHTPKGLEQTPFSSALKMTLFEITLPRESDDVSKSRSIKEIMSAMEQLYAGLLPEFNQKERKGEYFTLELSVDNKTPYIAFYCAILDHRRGLFEKQVLSIFPRAKIVERPNDYNIFDDFGEIVAAHVEAKKEMIFPIKTYDQFDVDPLLIVLNALSKLEEGEGASIQFVVHPAKEDMSKKYAEVIKKLDKGEKVGDAIDFSLMGDIWRTTKTLLFTKSKKEDEKDEPKDTTKQREAVSAIEQKLEARMSLVNIRIVVSTAFAHRSHEIRQIIEAAFNQFENNKGSNIRFVEVGKRHVRSFVHDYIYRRFRENESIPLNIRELTTLIHFPVRNLEGAREVKEAKANTSPAPVEISKTGVETGKNIHRGTSIPIYLTPEDRRRHLYVIGQTGTGKTTLLTNLCARDILNGDGCCFLDPHGSDLNYLLSIIPTHRYDDVIYFDPAHIARPMGLNMLEFDENYPEQKTFVVNELLSIFNKLFDMKVAGGPMFEQYFRNSALLVMEDPASGNTLLEIARVMTDKSFRDLKLSRCKNPIIRQFWDNATKTTGEQKLENFVPYITNKFDVFISNDIMRPIIAQEKSVFNFREIMDNKKILLVNLSKGRLGDINSSLIGLILVGKILMAALSRVDSHGVDLPDFYLYIDEFQNVTTPSISTILSEARKYKLSLNIAHQFIKQLDEGIRDSIFGNVGSMAVYRVGAEDAEFLQKQYQPVFSAYDIQNLDNFNYYARFLMGGIITKPFSVVANPPLSGNTSQVEQLKNLSYLKYGRPRDEVEDEIMARYKKEETQRPEQRDPFADFSF